MAAGLAMLVAVVLVPQQQARREAELGLAPLQFAKDRLLERHARYDLAIFQLDEQEPAVMDRLVRSKLHLRPLDADRDDGPPSRCWCRVHRREERERRNRGVAAQLTHKNG